MKNILCSTLILSALFIGSEVSAQDAVKKTILVNGVATEVMISPDGQVQSSLRERPQYMDGYVQAPANLRRTSNTTNPVIAEVDNARTTNGDLIVDFGKDKFSINSDGFETLEDVVSRVKSANKGFVLLRSKFVASSSASNVIAQKRVSACKKYLETKGLAPNKILISLEPGDVASDAVNIFIR